MQLTRCNTSNRVQNEEIKHKSKKWSPLQKIKTTIPGAHLNKTINNDRKHDKSATCDVVEEKLTVGLKTTRCRGWNNLVIVHKLLLNTRKYEIQVIAYSAQRQGTVHWQ